MHESLKRSRQALNALLSGSNRQFDTWLDLAVRSFIPPWFYRNVHQIRSRFLHFLHALLTLQLDAEWILPPAFEMAEKGSFYGLRVSPNNDIRCFWMPAHRRHRSVCILLESLPPPVIS